MAKPVQVTDSTFDKMVVESEQPVLVDFLGGMVRPLQDDRTRPRRDRHGPRR